MKIVTYSIDAIEQPEESLKVFNELEEEARNIVGESDSPIFLAYRMEKRSFEGEVLESYVKFARYYEEYIEALVGAILQEDVYGLFTYKDIIGSDLPHNLANESGEQAGTWTVSHLALINPNVPINEREIDEGSPFSEIIGQIPDYSDHFYTNGFFNGKFNISKLEELLSKNPSEVDSRLNLLLDVVESPEVSKIFFEEFQIALLSTYKNDEAWEEIKKRKKEEKTYEKKHMKWVLEGSKGEEPRISSREEWLAAQPPIMRNRIVETESLKDAKKFDFNSGTTKILTNESIMGVPCSWFALKKAGISEEALDEIKNSKKLYANLIRTHWISKALSKYHYQLCVYSMKKSCFKTTSNTYPPNKKAVGWTKIKVNVYDNHMFVHRKVFSPRANKEVSVLTAIAKGFESGLLERFNAYEFYRYYTNFTLDPMIKFNLKEFFSQSEDGGRVEGTMLKKKEGSDIPDKIYYADFETTTDEEHHIPYMVHCIGPDMDMTFLGEDCAKNMFLAIHKDAKPIPINETGEYTRDPHIRIMFHNLKYDGSFLRGDLRRIDECAKGNQLYSFSGYFGAGSPYKQIELEFWDTLPIMRCKLSKAAEFYIGGDEAKQFRKEACPYAFYTRKNFEKYPDYWCPLEEFCKGFNNADDLNRFLAMRDTLSREIYNPEEETINYMQYSAFYCRQDVIIMKKAYENIRKLFLGEEIEGIHGTPPFKIDILQYRTISSLAWAYFVNTTFKRYFKGEYNEETDQINDKNDCPIFMLSTEGRVIGRMAARGGRTMIANNEPYHYVSPNPDDPQWDVVDYDAVSLYPTAGSKAFISEGLPKIIKGQYNREDFLRMFDNPEEKEKTKQFTDGWIHVIWINARTPRKFPMICIKDPKTKLNNYKNFENEQVDTMISMVDLYNFVDYQDGEFLWDAAIVWEGNRNFLCQDVFKNLNEFRKKNHNLKDEKGNDIPDHPIANLSKLVSNSIYGKTNQKVQNFETVIVDKYSYRRAYTDYSKKLEFIKENNWEKYFNNNAYRIIDFEPILGRRDHFKVKQYRVDKGYALVPFAVNILAFARRSIGQVTVFAEEAASELGVPGPFYTDTDSIHLLRCTLPIIEEKFRQKYGFELSGGNLGQYHIDFDKPSNFKKEEKVRGAIESIFCAKKVYADKLVSDWGNIGYHQRMKGICSDLVNWQDFVDFYEDKPVIKDLALAKPIFKHINGEVISLKHMVRRVMSRTCKARLEREEKEAKKVADRVNTWNFKNRETSGDTEDDMVVEDEATPTPPLSPDHCPIEPEPWVNKPWDPSCDGPTQPLPPDDLEIFDEDTQFPSQKRLRDPDDEINIETDDEEPVLKIAKIDD